MRSAAYTGMVMHERLRPRRHRLSYRVFCVLIDLDEVDTLNRWAPLFGVDRRALLSVRSGDHGDGRTPLREWAAGLLDGHGVSWDGGRIEVLCYPRILGVVFNPLSVWYCRNRDETLAAILYEVHNTHGERHTYVIPATGSGRTIRNAARKQFFVSPFMPMDCIYHFRLLPPGRRVGVTILEDDDMGRLLTATFTGARRELSKRALAGLLFAYPLMTLKVVAAIHWEALKLLLKRVPFHRWRPAAASVASSPADLRTREDA